MMMTLVEATKIGVSAGLAAATQIPDVRMPVWIAIGGVVIVAFLGVVSSGMPSWAASPEVSKAATAAEEP
jgi:hypothetical protein